MASRDHRDSSAFRKLEKGLKNLSTEEQDQIRSLLKDKDSKEDEKVEWLYKESKPDQEDYLLGRHVDRFVDQSTSREVAVKDIPGSTFKVEDDELIARRADLDMHAKMREDPLFAIRKKEEEAKRRLLENPVKMKQLQKIISMRETEKKKKKEKKHKKHKKHKKKGDSTDSSDEDDDLVNKYLKILGKKHRLDDPDVKARLKNSMDDDDIHKTDDKPRRNKHSDSSDKYRHKEKHAKHRDRRDDTHRRLTSQSSDEETCSRSHQSDRHGDQRHGDQRAQYGLVKTSRYRSPDRDRRKHRSRSRSPVRQRSLSPYRHSRRMRSRSPNSEPKTKKLSAEEKDRLRQEMMNDAKERDKQRLTNIKLYEEEEHKEKQNQEKHGGSKDKFINSLMTDHVSQSSVEDRIKRNKYNVQRTKAALENSFRKH